MVCLMRNPTVKLQQAGFVRTQQSELPVNYQACDPVIVREVLRG